MRLAVRAAFALGCTVHPRSIFARKNYFYPDLPKGYQISQFEEPLATGGRLEFVSAERGPDHRAHQAAAPGGGRGQVVPRPRAGDDGGGLQPLGRAADRDRERAGPALARGGARVPHDAEADARSGIPGGLELQHGRGKPAGGREPLHPAGRVVRAEDAHRSEEHELLLRRGARAHGGAGAADRGDGAGRTDRADDDALRRGLGRGAADALQGGSPRLPLLPGAGPPAAGAEREVARRRALGRCPSCRRRSASGS